MHHARACTPQASNCVQRSSTQRYSKCHKRVQKVMIAPSREVYTPPVDAVSKYSFWRLRRACDGYVVCRATRVLCCFSAAIGSCIPEPPSSPVRGERRRKKVNYAQQSWNKSSHCANVSSPMLSQPLRSAFFFSAFPRVELLPSSSGLPQRSVAVPWHCALLLSLLTEHCRFCV